MSSFEIYDTNKRKYAYLVGGQSDKNIYKLDSKINELINIKIKEQEPSKNRRYIRAR